MGIEETDPGDKKETAGRDVMSKKKTLILAAAGFLMGMVIGDLIAVLTGGGSPTASSLAERTGSETSALIVQTLLSGVYGAIGMGGVSFYDMEEWSLLRSALTHYLCIMISYIPIALFLGWIRPDHFIADYGVILIAQTAAYVIIFMIMSAIYRKEVRELNRMIEERAGRNENVDKKA